MGIVNRSKDSSEQYELHNNLIQNTVTAKSDAVVQMPYPATIISAKLGAVGPSGSPTAQLQIRRFVTGAGQTLIPLGAALALQAVSTSGPQSYTFSTTSLNAGDTIVCTHAGANSAVEQVNVALVVQAIQDIKSWNF